MSYILDALTKAAQQRDRRIPVIQRLLAPAARVPRPGWTRSFGRLFVALAVNAGLLTVLVFWWLQPFAEPPASVSTVQVPATAPTTEPIRSAAAPARSSVEPPRAAPEPARSAAASLARRAAEPPRPAIAEPPAAAPRAERPAPAGRSVAVAPPAVVAPQAPAPIPVPTPLRPVPLPQAPPIVGSPLNPVTPAVPPSASRPLKLEALIYSDVPSQRMVFINGRRYVQGDLVDGRLRVEEIHEDGVDLSEQGRRTTLRATR